MVAALSGIRGPRHAVGFEEARSGDTGISRSSSAARRRPRGHRSRQTISTTGKEADVADAIKDEMDDDPFDFTPPPGPTPSQVRRRWAQEGNVEALLAEIRSKSWGCFSVDEALKHVLRACE